MTELPQILPLLWLHGEPFPVLEEEIRAMHGAGLRGFILESRPFPDYLGPHWWETLHFVLGLAEQLGMKALIFDDSHFPSGYAGGIIAKEHPQYLRLLLEGKTRRFRMAETGEYSFDAQEFLADGDRKVLKLFFLPMTGEKTFSAAGKIVCEPGRGSVRLSAGEWLLLAAVITRNGGEKYTRNYINMISPAAVREYIRIIYERHVRELADHLGKSFCGFFSDEPRLANLPSYDAVIGVADMPLPYSEELDFDWDLLPHLLFASDDPDADREIRVRFMDRVSRLYSESFPQQIGRFCREHGLVYIGHVIEDNGAHVRLGYGDGHYFRSQEGQTWAGVDTVLGQNRPGFTEGILPSVFGEYRSEFFHWGLMNLASSMGALRRMPSFCEIFGAYGWGEGLSRMKWHTDLAVVRGISRLVPHAFSPKECPDPDCPPHFYARGKNPQWPYFSRWVRYADQICRFAGDGKNAASVGILYHAEAEWGNGMCIPCERMIAALAKRQISSLIIPFDYLENTTVSNGALEIGDARITIFAAADFDRLPDRVRAGLLRLEKAGLLLIRITGENLIAEAEKLDPLRDIKTEKIIPFLRVLHLRNGEGDRYFLVNESLAETVDTVVSGLSGMKFHDPLREMDYRFDGRLFLLPGESIFLVPGSSDVPLPVPGEKTVLLKKETFSCLNGTLPPDFCGKAVYEREWLSGTEGKMLLLLSDQQEDAVVCSVNGNEAGTCFSSPYRFEVKLKKGPNRIRLEIVNTLYPLYGKNRFDEDCPCLPPGLRSDILLSACFLPEGSSFQ